MAGGTSSCPSPWVETRRRKSRSEVLEMTAVPWWGRESNPAVLHVPINDGVASWTPVPRRLRAQELSREAFPGQAAVPE